ARPGLRLARIAQHEGRSDAFLVREAALGAEAVLAEEIAIVAEKEDECIIKLTAAVERLEDHADAFIHRGHHARALANFLLRPRANRRENSARALGCLQLERLGPCGFGLRHLGGCEHIRLLREDGVAVEVSMALGCDVAPEAGHIERAVRSLMRVRMYRL